VPRACPWVSTREHRKVKKTEEETRKEVWTIDSIWKVYLEQKHYYRSRYREENLYKRHIKPHFGAKEPSAIAPLDVDRVRIGLQREGKLRTAAYTVGFLKRIVRFGEEKGLCEGLRFRLAIPKHKSQITNYLNEEQLQALLDALNADNDPQARGVIRIALYTGMRRSAIFRLRWDDLDFSRGLIFLREPKGGQEGEVHVIPMNSAARETLENHPRRDGTPYVFPGIKGGQRVGFKRSWERIKKRANLPGKFRFHDFRHTFGTIAALNGVDPFTLKSIMTHSEIKTTERYIHISQEWAAKASEAVALAINKAKGDKKEQAEERTTASVGIMEANRLRL